MQRQQAKKGGAHCCQITVFGFGSVHQGTQGRPHLDLKACSICHDLNQISIWITIRVIYLGRWVTADDARLNPWGPPFAFVLETYQVNIQRNKKLLICLRNKRN